MFCAPKRILPESPPTHIHTHTYTLLLSTTQSGSASPDSRGCKTNSTLKALKVQLVENDPAWEENPIRVPADVNLEPELLCLTLIDSESEKS